MQLTFHNMKYINWNIGICKQLYRLGDIFLHVYCGSIIASVAVLKANSLTHDLFNPIFKNLQVK